MSFELVEITNTEGMSTNDNTQEASVYKMQCNFCKDPYSLEELFVCQHIHCKNDKSIYCKDCGEFYHKKKKKSHVFTTEKLEEIKLNQDDIQPEEEEKCGSNSLELTVYQVECELCHQQFTPPNLWICRHMTCDNDRMIHCMNCGEFVHKQRKRAHQFDPEQVYMACVADMIIPDQNNFNSGKWKGKLLIEGVGKIDKILWDLRWIFSAPSYALSLGAQTATSVILNSTPTVVAACDLGGKVVGHALAASAVGGAVGTIVATGFEAAYIWRQQARGRISVKEACILTGTALLANGISAASFFGFMALGAAMGTPGGPVGVTIGAIIGAIVAGVVTRVAVNKGVEYYYKHKQKARTKLQREALKFFFHDEKYDVNDESKFNEKIIRRTYHRLSLIYHPDKKDGDIQEWMQLSSYYGILVGIWEKKHEKDDKHISVNGLSTEQRRLVIESTIKQHPSMNINEYGTE